ncbi:MAG: presqualene diphosphate synthase HpnD [Mariprofundaceae bacterium]
MNPARYCEEKARGSGSSFFYAFLFLQEEQRRAMIALYAFCREVDDIADEISDAQVAASKLVYWRNEIDRVYEGSPTHPIGKELNRAIQHFGLGQKHFHEVMDGIGTDIAGTPYLKKSDLSQYCYRVAGAVGLLSIKIFGHSSPTACDFAIALGEALQLTNILRDLKEDADRNRIYIPREDRLKFGVRDEDFMRGNMTNGMKSLLVHYGDKADVCYRKAVNLLPACDRTPLRPSLIMGSIYYAHLQRLKATDFDVWQQPVRLLPVRKIWIAWKAWHREKRATSKGIPATFAI